VPYRMPTTSCRVPLAPGGEECPLIGKTAVLAFFAGVYDAFGSTHVKEYYFNDMLSAVYVQAEIELRATGKMLRVANVFNVDQHGRVTAQHNHFDPRPAIA
jgi:hypothetical protein